MTTVPIVSIVGKSQSGKTLLMERLIVEFKGRGYRVAALKHSRGGMEVDYPGKDSWRFTRAGSDAVLVISPGKLAFIKSVEHEPGIEEIMRIIGPDFDIVLAEGFKKSKLPKIEVLREDFGDELVCSREELSAIITDRPLDIGVPILAPGDTQGITDFIEREFLRPSPEAVCSDSPTEQKGVD
ncbi:MAG: molybdopterin-guanine dinucleotide biosynthesis protein B [Dehalococcoidia bacterium]